MCNTLDDTKSRAVDFSLVYSLDKIKIEVTSYGNRDVYLYSYNSYGNINNYIFDTIGKKRGCLIKGGEVDYDKVCNVVINDIKDGLIKNITFDRVDEHE